MVRPVERSADTPRRTDPWRPFAPTLPVAALGALAILVGASGIRVAWNTLRAHSYFVVQRVEVVGLERVPAAEIRAHAGIPPDGTVWLVDLEAVRAQVLRHPWVVDAQVRREPPDAVAITVRERELVAVLTGSGTPVGVDRHGHAFAVLPPALADSVPAITGLPAGDVAARRMLRDVARLLRTLAPRHPVRTVRVDPDAGVTVRMGADVEVPVDFGWGAWRAKRRRLETVLRVWAGRERDLRAISVAGGDHVVVRVRRGAT